MMILNSITRQQLHYKKHEETPREDTSTPSFVYILRQNKNAQDKLQSQNCFFYPCIQIEIKRFWTSESLFDSNKNLIYTLSRKSEPSK